MLSWNVSEWIGLPDKVGSSERLAGKLMMSNGGSSKGCGAERWQFSVERIDVFSQCLFPQRLQTAGNLAPLKALRVSQQ